MRRGESVRASAANGGRRGTREHRSSCPQRTLALTNREARGGARSRRRGCPHHARAPPCAAGRVLQGATQPSARSGAQRRGPPRSEAAHTAPLCRAHPHSRRLALVCSRASAHLRLATTTSSMPARSPCCFSNDTNRSYRCCACDRGMWSSAYLRRPNQAMATAGQTTTGASASRGAPNGGASLRRRNGLRLCGRRRSRCSAGAQDDEEGVCAAPRQALTCRWRARGRTP